MPDKRYSKLQSDDPPADDPDAVTTMAPGAIDAPPQTAVATASAATEDAAPASGTADPLPTAGDNVVYQSGPETFWPATVASAAPGVGGPICALEVHERTGTVRVPSAPYSAEPRLGTWRYPA